MVPDRSAEYHVPVDTSNGHPVPTRTVLPVFEQSLGDIALDVRVGQDGIRIARARRGTAAGDPESEETEDEKCSRHP